MRYIYIKEYKHKDCLPFIPENFIPENCSKVLQWELSTQLSISD